MHRTRREKDGFAQTPPAPAAPVQTGVAEPSFDAAFDRAFVLIAFRLNRHLIDHMLRASRAFDIDYESLVIWGVLSHQNVAHLLPPGNAPASMLTERGRIVDHAAELRPLRLRDMAQITGIARETVRRKLALLEAAGRVRRVTGGWVVNRDMPDAPLREFTRESARRFLAAAKEVSDALDAAASMDEGSPTLARQPALTDATRTARGRRAGMSSKP